MSSIEFAEAARRLGHASRALGYDTPTFRGPPRSLGVQRSIRWRKPTSRSTPTAQLATVSVRISQRPFAAVLADMIDGVVAANRIDGPEAGIFRDQLWDATAELVAPRETSVVPLVAAV